MLLKVHIYFVTVLIMEAEKSLECLTYCFLVEVIMQIIPPSLQYQAYKIKKDDGSYCSFIFNDIMGLEERTDKGVKVEDVKLALKGHVSKEYQVKC